MKKHRYWQGRRQELVGFDIKQYMTQVQNKDGAERRKTTNLHDMLGEVIGAS